VRDEDLGTVRGQPIRPVLAGFGEPVTDWLFQSALEARPGESAFCLRAGEGWPRGQGWLCGFALRWLGEARRLLAPDSIAAVWCPENGPIGLLSAAECIKLAASVQPDGWSGQLPVPDALRAAACGVAREALRERVVRQTGRPRAAVGLALLFVAAVRPGP